MFYLLRGAGTRGHHCQAAMSLHLPQRVTATPSNALRNTDGQYSPCWPRRKYKCSTKWNTRGVKSLMYYLSSSLKNLTFTYFPQVFKFKRKKDPSCLFQVYRWVVWGEPLLSRASLQVGATTYPFSLLYRYLIPTLCPPSEHQCSSGIVRHYCVQDIFFLTPNFHVDYWQTAWYVCRDAFIGCSENHRWSHSSPEKYVNVLFVTYWPAGRLCNIGVELFCWKGCVLFNRGL